MQIQKMICLFRLSISSKQRKILETYRNLKKRSFNPLSVLQKRQLDKLNDILNHSYKNVPYYQQLFEELNIVQNGEVSFKDIKEIQSIPFLTKEIIRQAGSDLHSKDIKSRKTYINSSGGSTGEPVEFIQDTFYKHHNTANFLLIKSWKQCEPCDSTVTIWGAERDILSGKRPFKENLLDFQLNRIRLNSFKMSNELMQKYIETLNKKKPKLIIAYVQSIYELAKFAKENDIHVEKQHAIHAAAGTVYDYMRKTIEEVFQCKVFNHYGSREVGPIASECSAHDGLHIMMEHTLVEVVNEKGEPCKPGEEGEIVVTSLNNYAMPLIRYKIGDIGVMQEYSPCPCGCNYPKLQKVIGRTTDLFLNTKGEKIDGEYFTHLFYFRDWIEKFQFIQEDIDNVTVKIVKKDEVPQKELEEIEKKIKLVMGNECKVTYRFVDDIPKTKTGKFLYTISKINKK